MKIIRHPLFMRPNPESELEQAIDRELRRLPPLRAPADLMPSVMAAIAAREARPWWQKPAAQWPLGARLGFLVGTTGLAAFLLYFAWGVTAGVSFGALADEVAVYSSRLETVRSIGSSLGNAAVTVVRPVGSWLVWSAAGLLGMCYLTTLALGTFCYRLAAQRA